MNSSVDGISVLPTSCWPHHHSLHCVQTANEWGVVLRDMYPSIRRKFLSLSLATEGLNLEDIHSVEHKGLQRLKLRDLLVPVHAGSSKLMFSASYRRVAMQVISVNCQM